jgi:hypothetical protein
MKVFLKVSHTHLYTNQKEIKQEIFLSLHTTWPPMAPHVIPHAQ